MAHDDALLDALNLNPREEPALVALHKLLIQQGIKPPYSDEVTEAGLAIFSHLGEPKPGKVGRSRRESGKLTRAEWTSVLVAHWFHCANLKGVEADDVPDDVIDDFKYEHPPEDNWELAYRQAELHLRDLGVNRRRFLIRKHVEKHKQQLGGIVGPGDCNLLMQKLATLLRAGFGMHPPTTAQLLDERYSQLRKPRGPAGL